MDRWFLLVILIVSAGVAAPGAGFAQHTTASTSTDTACFRCPRPRPLLAVASVLGSNIFLNRFNTWVLNVHDPVDGYWARVSPQSWSANLRSGWTWDSDNFNINMFGHPYQGGTYFRSGRTNGLSFWGSVPLAFLGSAEWEFFGETTKPSLNDFYNTGFGGIVIGEMVYRLVAVIRDNQAHGAVRVLRELAALPLDPTGGFRRLVGGDFTRVYANPGEHAPPPLALQLQGGGAQARDSGVAGRRALGGVFVAELSYGDAFATPYARPFDVFLARALVIPGASPIGELRIAGRLYAREFTSTSAPVRTIFTVRQKIEYTENPAYKFGGQSVEAGMVTGFSLGRGVEARTEGYAEAIMLGAVDAPGAGDPGTPRSYDFGPGVGADLAASLQVRHFPVLSARYHWSMIHSVSGSPADHYTQLPSIEVALPLTRMVGLGAYAGWYTRRSTYADRPEEVRTYVDLRAYLVWRTRPHPAAPEPK
jgi:Domain of unknown function (DUF3943)